MGSTGAPPAAWHGPKDSRKINQHPIQPTASHTEIRISPIRLNTDLAKKPPECLEYIVVHELLHLLEPTHNARFAALMDLHLPHWQQLRRRLNSLPVRHEEWGY